VICHQTVHPQMLRRLNLGAGGSKATIWMFNPLRDEKGIERLRDED